MYALGNGMGGGEGHFPVHGDFHFHIDSAAELPVYNRTVGLRDTFAKQSK